MDSKPTGGMTGRRKVMINTPITPPPMPDIREALENIRDLENAVERAKRCWNRTQLADALRSVRYFLDLADKELEEREKRRLSLEGYRFRGTAESGDIE